MGRITIAEDLQHNKWLTKDVGAGGAGFGCQWDAMFVHPIRQAVIIAEDEQRSLACIRDAICYRYNDNAFDRVIYSESHDEVANGKGRVPQEISPNDPKGWYARKRSTLAATMVFTAPGIPMLFQGQEFLEGGWFRDTVPVDWDQNEEFHGIVRLYRDLIRLRLNHAGCTRGLCGQFTQVYHLNEERKVIAFHRWDKGGPADDVVVVANFFNQPQDGYVIGLPAAGTWKLLNVHVSGKLEKADYEHFVPEFERLARQHGKLRVLFDMTGFHGWEASAAWEDFKFGMKHLSDIERIAMVGEKRWQHGMAIFCKPFIKADVCYLSKDLPQSMPDRMRADGIQVLIYRRKISPWTFRRKRLRRMHRKIVVVDREIAFVDGINIIADREMTDAMLPR